MTLDCAHLEAATGAFVVGWCTWTPRACWTALRASWAILKGLPMPSQNPIALVGAALKLGQDGVKLYQDLQSHNKADAVAATLDALPALATVTGESLSDLQAIVTADNLGVAYDLAEDLAGVIPLVKAALEKYRTPAA